MKSFTDIDRKLCPRCKSEAPFWIQGTTERLLDVDENVLHEVFEWGPGSDCECDSCHFKGRVGDFIEEVERTEEERKGAIRALLATLEERHLRALEGGESHLDAPWTLDFDRDGTEDLAIVCDADGEELVRSRPFWLPEGTDPMPPTLAAVRLMVAAPEMMETLQLALTALNAAPNFKVGEASSHEIASRIEKTLNRAHEG